jgi:hypothetical protein
VNFKNQFIAHRKIDILDLATIKKDSSKSGMVNFCIVKNTIIESTINKSNCHKIAVGEITIRKFTVLKLLVIDLFHTISDVVVFDIKEIFGH